MRVPDLGDNIDKGNVVGVLVAVGDTIEQNQGVLELETDKATVEVPAASGGVVKEIFVHEGDKIGAGGLVLVVETTAAVVAPSTPAPVASPEPVEPVVSAAPVEPPPPPKPVAAPASASVNVSAVVASVRQEGLPLRHDRAMIPAAPNVRRIARELGVDITEVEGTGPAGRVSLDDVKRHAYRLLRALRAGLPLGEPAAAPRRSPSARFWSVGAGEPHAHERHSAGHRRQMEVAWSNIPHVTQFDKADITELEQLRQRFAPKWKPPDQTARHRHFAESGGRGAERVSPILRSIDMAKEELIYKNYYHLVRGGGYPARPAGAGDPHVDQKNILELAVELGELAVKARDRKLTPARCRAASFPSPTWAALAAPTSPPLSTRRKWRFWG